MFKKSLISIQTLFIILIALGIFLRLNNYLDSRALWNDETLHARDIINQSFSEIIKGENFIVSNPIGFAVITKIFIKIGGYSEYILRLFPFISGIIVLFIFYLLIKNTTSYQATLLSLSLFILSPPIIYFSTEAKHFMLDILTTVGIYLSIKKLRSIKKPTFQKILLLSLVGGISLWFSFSAIFILTAIICAYLIDYFKNPSKKEILFQTIVLSTIWTVNFITVYILFINKRHLIKGLSNMWATTFWPHPLWSSQSLIWIKKSLWEMFTYSLGSSFTYIAIIMFLLGGYFVFKKSRFNFLIFTLPFLLVLIASILRLYPFHGRMLVFLIPAICIFIGEGLNFFLKKNKIFIVTSIFISTFLLFNPKVAFEYLN